MACPVEPVMSFDIHGVDVYDAHWCWPRVEDRSVLGGPTLWKYSIDISDKASEYKYLCQYSSTSSTEMLANSKDKYSSSNGMNINTATDYKFSRGEPKPYSKAVPESPIDRLPIQPCDTLRRPPCTDRAFLQVLAGLRDCVGLHNESGLPREAAARILFV